MKRQRKSKSERCEKRMVEREREREREAPGKQIKRKGEREEDG
jgi:hypothetical protein